MIAAGQQGEQPAHPGAGLSSKGTVTQDEEGLYMVNYPHDASKTEYLLGLFESEEETKRVRDVLTIKEAVDKGLDLRSLRLFFTLQRYGVDSDTVREIRAVSFRQVVRDLQVCAIKPLRSPDDQQPTSWVAGAVTRPTNGPMKASPATVQAQQRQLAQPPGPGRAGQQLSPDHNGSSFAAADNQHAALALVPSGAGSPAQPPRVQQAPAAATDRLRPAQPPPRFEQMPPLPPLPSMLQPGEQQAQPPQYRVGQQQGSGNHGKVAQQNGRRAAAVDGRRTKGMQRGGRKRKAVDDSRVNDEEAASMQRLLEAVEDVARGTAPPSDPASLTHSEEGLPAAGARRGRAVKQRRAEASPLAGYQPGVRPWQGQDVLGFTVAEHPFHGVTRDGGQMSAQIVVRYNGDVPNARGAAKRNIRFARCSGPALAAVIWDLAAIWRALRYGEDPAELDAAPEASQALNFSFERYAPHLPALRLAQTAAALQKLVRELRDEPGTLVSLATGRPMGPTTDRANGSSPSNSDAAAAAAAGAINEEEADLGTAAAEAAKHAMDADADPAAATAVPAAGRQGAAGAVPAAGAAPAAKGGGRFRSIQLTAPRGTSGYKGVYGEGPWVAQVGLCAKQMLPDRLQGWTSSRSQQSVRLGSFSSPALAAACADLLSLWRAKQYGDPLEDVALNFRLALYTPFLPGLDEVRLPGIQAHVAALRDSGSLQPVAEAGQQAQQGEKPAQQAQQAQQQTREVMQGEQMGSGAAAAVAAGTPASPGLPPAAEQPERVSVPGPASGERQQKQQLRSKTHAAQAGTSAAAAPAAALAETTAAAAARGAAVAASGAPPDPTANVEALAQGLLQHLRTMTPGELQKAAYRPDEQPQVHVAQAMYVEVQAALAATPQLSELEAVAYMAQFAQLRDLRSQLYREIMGWSEAGRHDLLVQHVRHMLPPHPASVK